MGDINARLSAKLPGVHVEAVPLRAPQQLLKEAGISWDVKASMPWSDFHELRNQCRWILQQGSEKRNLQVLARMVAAALEDMVYVPQPSNSKLVMFEMYKIETGAWDVLHRELLVLPISRVLLGLGLEDDDKLARSLVDPVMQQLLEAPRLPPLDSDPVPRSRGVPPPLRLLREPVLARGAEGHAQPHRLQDAHGCGSRLGGKGWRFRAWGEVLRLWVECKSLRGSDRGCGRHQRQAVRQAPGGSRRGRSFACSPATLEGSGHLLGRQGQHAVVGLPRAPKPVPLDPAARL